MSQTISQSTYSTLALLLRYGVTFPKDAATVLAMYVSFLSSLTCNMYLPSEKTLLYSRCIREVKMRRKQLNGLDG